jgi:hypothetical protein
MRSLADSTVLHRAKQVRTHSGFARACGIRNQHASGVIQNPERLRNTTHL